MKKDIILAGVGGQGILSIAAIIGLAAMKKGWFIKQSEVHGMSQRGGDVQSHLRISDKYIWSDLIPQGEADIIISMEPMECLRYVNMLKEKGWLITNSQPFQNIPNYPDTKDIEAEIKKLKNHIIIPATQIAKEINTEKSVNVVILGAAYNYLGVEEEFLIEAIRTLFTKKGESVVNQNINAFEAGKKFAITYIQ